MIVRYPWERVVDGLWWEAATDDDVSRFVRAIGGQIIATADHEATGPTLAAWKRSHAVVWREFDRDMNYVAPKWIAWLYRWLPHSLGWHGKQYDSVDFAPYFLWSLHALKWSLAWLPRRRARQYGVIRLGVLRFNERVLTL